MCGIAGVLDWEGLKSDYLTPMLAAIRHRGPDDEGRYSDPLLSMGMRRLSIIDLSGGHQPIFNEDGTVAVVFNGEIYNYIELRDDLESKGHRFKTKSDTEVLVHLYEEYGADMVPYLNGMFGYSIWDQTRRRLLVVRDRLGVKPMYYAATKSGLAYGSEMKSILATGLVPKQLDKNAIAEYLGYHYIPGEQTPFKGIQKLLPGHWILAENGQFRIQRYWNLADRIATPAISYSDARERVRELFLDSIRLRMRSDAPVGAYLSGGLDSSLVTAAAAKHTDIQMSTFSVEFSQSEFDELPYARTVAKHVGTKHNEIRVTPDDALRQLPRLVWLMDEPNGDSALLPTFLVSKLAVSQVKVALSGIGADELFGGYHRYHMRLGKFEQLANLPTWALRIMRPLLGSVKNEWQRKLDRMIAPMPEWREFMDKTHRFDEQAIQTLTGIEPGTLFSWMRKAFDTYPGKDFVNQRMFADAHTYLPDQILALTDRMSMAVSLEARTPFLDYRLFEFASSLPGEWKVSGSNWKIILKEALGDLVPESILKRPKWGFAAPVQSWMGEKRLNPLVQLCKNSHLVRDGVLDQKAMQDTIADPSIFTHNSSWLWTLGILEIWYRSYVSGDPTVAPEMDLEAFSRDGK